MKNNLKYHYAGATEELRQYIKVGVWSVNAQLNLVQTNTEYCNLEPTATSHRRPFPANVSLAKEEARDVEGLWITNRCGAGLRKFISQPTITALPLQVVLLHTIGNPSKPLRQTGGTSVAVIVGVGGLQNWPELIAAFTTCLESNDKHSLEGALDALYKVLH